MKVIDTANMPALSEHDQQLVYCGLDSALTLEIDAALDALMDDTARKTYEGERSLLDPVVYMMNRGMLIDPEKRDEVARDLTARKAIVAATLNELAGYVWDGPLNHNSPLQLKKFFFEALAIPPIIVAKKGEKKVSTDREALEKISRSYVRGRAFAQCIIRLRDIDKVLSATTKGLLDGRWHANFNIAGTDTGRWSSSSHPFDVGANLQNIDDEVRRMFVADPGMELFSCDQQGAESRAVAYLSGDPGYIKGVEDGDIHTMVAAMTWGFEFKRELADRKFYRDMSYRDVAKRLGHGSNYLGQAKTLSQLAVVELELVEEFQKRYFKGFPGIVAWQKWTAQQIQTKGYLLTPFGRRRFFWDRTREDTTVRQAIAMVPQSTIGEYTARAIERIYRNMPEVEVLNNVHDAVIGQYDKNKRIDLKPRIMDHLEEEIAFTDILGVVRRRTIPWEFSAGLNWGKSFKDKKTGEQVNPNGLKVLT